MTHSGISKKEERVRENVCSVENMGISRRIVGKDNRHPKRTPQRKRIQLQQVQVQVWLMRYCLLVMFHININIGC